MFANKYCNSSKVLLLIPVAAYSERAILIHADRFGLLAVAKGPAVVKPLCNCPIAQRLFKIMESTKKLIDKKSAHLDSLIYMQKRVYNCGKSMIIKNEKSGVKLRGMQDSSVVC
jgi:hypothetical protein